MKNGIEIDRVSFSYERNDMQLNKVSLHIPSGSFYGITGTNGSGKTTLTMLLNGLIPHHLQGHFDGNVYVDGINTRTKPVDFFASKVGMVFQNPDFMIFNLSVREEIEFGLKNLVVSDLKERVSQALATVGLAGYEERDPHSLSFGQKQKLCLACILALDTRYIVLDEPVAMLDYKSSIALYELLQFLNKKGKTIIVVEHDSDFLYRYSHEVALIDKGEIVTAGKPKQFFTQKKLLASIGIKMPRIV